MHEVQGRRHRFTAQNLQREINVPAAVMLYRVGGGADERKIGALQRGAAQAVGVLPDRSDSRSAVTRSANSNTSSRRRLI